MARKNRPPVEVDPVYLDLLANPSGFTRAARRSYGFRQPVWVGPMRQYHAENDVMPRFVRRHLVAIMGPNTRRNRKARARAIRAFQGA